MTAEDKTPWKIQRGWSMAGSYYYMYKEDGSYLESAWIGPLVDCLKKHNMKETK